MTDSAPATSLTATPQCPLSTSAASYSDEWYLWVHDARLERESGSLTVICALRDGDSLFLAADSSLGGLPAKTRSSGKIETIVADGIHLALAGSGDEAIADMFCDWLRRTIEVAKDKSQVSWEFMAVAGS